VEHDSVYIDLLIDTFHSVSAQMKSLLAKGATKDEAIAKIDFSAVEKRFTNGNAFLTNRFHDYVTSALPEAAYLAATGTGVKEAF
jgi:hypothetical protein